MFYLAEDTLAFWQGISVSVADLPSLPSSLPTPDYAASNNYYISQPGYKHRLNNKFYGFVPDPLWQLPVYVMASETCRMTDCKVIIDIGCGQAKKLALMPNKVTKIGVDIKPNVS